MAAGQATSAAAVEALVKGAEIVVAFLSQIPDKGPNQSKLLIDSVNSIQSAVGTMQSYVNSRVSGIS